MPTLNNRRAFQPNVGMFGAPNRGATAFPFPGQDIMRPQPGGGVISPLAQNIPTRAGAGPSTPQAQAQFCPTCGQFVAPQIQQQRPSIQQVSQSTEGRGSPSFGGFRGFGE